MKKNLYRSAFCALGAAALLGGFTACSDDNVDSPSYSFDVDTKTQTEGITSEIDGTVATFDIASNSDWKVSVPADAASWLDVYDTVGTGNRTISVYVEPMFGSSEGRSAKIRCYSASSNSEKYISVSQKPTYNGETVANDVASMKKVLLASQNGLGFGYSLNGDILYTPALRVSMGLKRLIEKNEDYDYLYSYRKYNKVAGESTQLDSVEVKKDSVGVSFAFDVSYAMFKLHIGGKYHGKEDKKSLTQTYNYAGKYNIARATLNVPEIVAMWRRAKNGIKDDEDDEIDCTAQKKKLLSVDLANLIDSITAAKDSASFANSVTTLVNHYGIGIIAEVELGSKLNLSMKFKRDSLAEVMGVDTAKIKTAIEGGLFQVGLNVGVDYQSDAKRIFENCAYTYEIEGGRLDEARALDSALSSPMSGDKSIFKTVHDKIDAWKETVNADEEETLGVNRVALCRIWELFTGDTADKVEKFIKNKYKAEIEKVFPKGL